MHNAHDDNLPGSVHGSEDGSNPPSSRSDRNAKQKPSRVMPKSDSDQEDDASIKITLSRDASFDTASRKLSSRERRRTLVGEQYLGSTERSSEHGSTDLPSSARNQPGRKRGTSTSSRDTPTSAMSLLGLDKKSSKQLNAEAPKKFKKWNFGDEKKPGAGPAQIEDDPEPPFQGKGVTPRFRRQSSGARKPASVTDSRGEDDDASEHSAAASVAVSARQKKDDAFQFMLSKSSALESWQMPEDLLLAPEQFSFAHAKLLVLISKYARAARHSGEQETWVRMLALSVMIYEGCMGGVLEYDYAPTSFNVGTLGKSRRMWMNMSFEGKAAIDDLREKGLVNGLKLCSEDYQSVVAYQASKKGINCVQQLPKQLLEEVDTFTRSPKPYKSSLLVVSFDGENFILTSEDGAFSRVSSVTDVESVSYVSSPYLPSNLLSDTAKPFTNNNKRAHEASIGLSNIRDELHEAIHLSMVNMICGEWVPMGCNQMVALNSRMGAFERFQGGYYSSSLDKNPTGTKFECPTGLTGVQLIDNDVFHYIALEAEINFPEEEGIVQVEMFGIHANVDGSIMYGMRVEAIGDRKANDISLDHLSRLQVDVQVDSSLIMNDLLSPYQRNLLDMVFSGDSTNRSKYSIVTADSIDPKLPALSYLDKEDNENELKQIVGHILSAHDIGQEDILLLGVEGLLLAGPNGHRLQPLLVVYASIVSRQMFIENFFFRTLALDESMKNIRKLIMQYDMDPNNLGRIRSQINAASQDISLLSELLSYLEQSTADLNIPTISLDQEPELRKTSQRLFDVLNFQQALQDMEARIKDLGNSIQAAAHQLENLSHIIDVTNTKQMEDILRNVDSNIKQLVDSSPVHDRTSCSLEVIQVILACSLSFEVLEKIGNTNVLANTSWTYDFVRDIVETPFLWFLLNILFMVVVGMSVVSLVNNLAAKFKGTMIVKVALNKKIDVEGLLEYLDTKEIDRVISSTTEGLRYRRCIWAEKDVIRWQGSPPKIEILYDDNFGFLLNVMFFVDSKNTRLTEPDLLKLFINELLDHDVLEQEEAFS